MEFPARVPPLKATGTWTASKFYSFLQEVDYEENFWSEDDMTENVHEAFTNSESRLVTFDPGWAPADPAVHTAVVTSIERQLDEAIKRNLLDSTPPESRDVSKIREEDFENIKRQVTVNKTSDVRVRYEEKQVFPVEVHPQANMPSSGRTTRSRRTPMIRFSASST